MVAPKPDFNVMIFKRNIKQRGDYGKETGFVVRMIAGGNSL